MDASKNNGVGVGVGISPPPFLKKIIIEVKLV